MLSVPRGLAVIAVLEETERSRIGALYSVITLCFSLGSISIDVLASRGYPRPSLIAQTFHFWLSGVLRMHTPSQDDIWEFDIFCFARFFFYSSRAFGGWLKGWHGGGGGFGAVLLSAFEMDDGGI